MAFILIILGYLLGSIPFGYILCKMHTGKDVRNSGSGATGATNVARQLGLKYAIIVSLLDIGKGALAVFIAILIFPENAWIHVGAGIFAVLGHCFPVWIGFRGGKGINTALGSALLISWQATVIAVVMFAIVFFISRFVSMASISAVIVYSIAVLLAGRFIGANELPIEVFAMVLPAIVIFTHRKNIARLIHGEELKPSKTA